jgi:hypothetical protein
MWDIRIIGPQKEDCPDQGDLKSRILELSRNLAEANTGDVPEEKEETREILASSIGYVVLSRCGMDTSGLAENFEGITHVGDLANIAGLGEATREAARDVLSRIENAVKRYERQKTRESRERACCCRGS